jgi:hypothetical protein
MAHDFRRTAVRNLERAGVSPFIRRDAMLGHRTESIYNRSTEYESASETQQALLGGDLGNSVRGTLLAEALSMSATPSRIVRR